jgi:hypothetical protein
MLPDPLPPLLALQLDDALAQRLLGEREKLARRQAKTRGRTRVRADQNQPPQGLEYEDLGTLAQRVAEREKGIVH